MKIASRILKLYKLWLALQVSVVSWDWTELASTDLTWRLPADYGIGWCLLGCWCLPGQSMTGWLVNALW